MRRFRSVSCACTANDHVTPTPLNNEIIWRRLKSNIDLLPKALLSQTLVRLRAGSSCRSAVGGSFTTDLKCSDRGSAANPPRAATPKITRRQEVRCHTGLQSGLCRLGVTSDKTHVEHNESALTLIADIPGDMDLRCNGPIANIANLSRECKLHREFGVFTALPAIGHSTLDHPHRTHVTLSSRRSP
jgi:hypothetical protein